MRERDGGHECRFRLGEGGVRVGRPKESFGCAPEEVCERFQNSGYAGKKSAIKIYQAEKPLELPQVRGGWEAVNSLHVAGERDNTTLTHHVPQELDGGGRESALGRINGESIFLQDFKDCVQMLKMLFHGGTSDQVGKHERQVSE